VLKTIGKFNEFLFFKATLHTKNKVLWQRSVLDSLTFVDVLEIRRMVWNSDRLHSKQFCYGIRRPNVTAAPACSKLARHKNFVNSVILIKNSRHILSVQNLLTCVPYFLPLLTPWCRVLLEKLTGLQLVKKFPALHGTRRFITALTSVRHLSLSWASSIQSIYTHPTSWRSVLILSAHLRLGLPSGTFSRYWI